MSGCQLSFALLFVFKSGLNVGSEIAGLDVGWKVEELCTGFVGKSERVFCAEGDKACRTALRTVKLGIKFVTSCSYSSPLAWHVASIRSYKIPSSPSSHSRGQEMK